MTNANLLKHPLISHHLTAMRDRQTQPFQFRHALRQLTGFVAVHATDDLALAETSVETPIRETVGHTVSQRIGLVPILRAGIGMVEPVLELLPMAEVWHIGLYRDEDTATPVSYYNKLIPGRSVDLALVLDPMLATGGSACLACNALREWGVSKIKMLSIISAPEGIQQVNSEFPDVEVYTCAIDEELNENSFIVPGLGDAGDRVFNTF